MNQDRGHKLPKNDDGHTLIDVSQLFMTCQLRPSSMSEGGITNPTYVEHEETVWELKEIKKRQAGEGKKGWQEKLFNSDFLGMVSI